MLKSNIKVYKLPKVKSKLVKGMTGVLLTTVLLQALAGCNVMNKNDQIIDDYYSNGSYYNNYYDNDYKENNNQNSNTSSNTTQNLDIKIADLDEYSLKIINSSITFDSNEMMGFANFVNRQEVIYPYSEIFNYDQVISKYNSVSNYTPSSVNYFEGGYISADKVYSIVKDNNKKANLAEVAKMSDSELYKICSVISDTINEYIRNYPDTNLNFLSEKLSELKILNYDNFSNGYYDATNGKMGFSTQYLNSISDEFYKTVVRHETYHFLESNSLKERQDRNIDTRFGFLYKFNDVDVNSFDWLWYIEGATEYLANGNNTSQERKTYESAVKSIDCIKIATLLNGSVNVDDFENLVLSKDLDDFFEYFNCNTEQEKREILNLMYSYSIKYNMNSSADSFFKTYKTKYSDGKYNYQISKELNNSIMKTLTKNFYYNLSLSLQNKTVTNEDIFALISIFESELSREFSYSVEYKNLESFFEFYAEIQSEFFEIIAKKTNTSVDEIQGIYNAYNKKMDIDLTNNTIINGEKKDFYNFIKESRKSNRINSINYFYQKHIEKER